MIWTLARLRERSRKKKHGDHRTEGLVVGSLGKGVSVDWSPNNVDLIVGTLTGPSSGRHRFRLNVAQAKDLGFSLLMAAVELEAAQGRQEETGRSNKRPKRRT